MSQGNEDHHFKIGERKMLWRYSRLAGDAVGWTYHGTKILIDKRLQGRRRLDTEIHEFLHFANPDHSEDAVTQQASDLAKILWALGYRLK